MSFDQILQNLTADSLRSLRLFSPELVLSAGVVLLLFLRLFSVDRWIKPYWMALGVSLAAFGLSFLQYRALNPIAGQSSFLSHWFSEPGTFFTSLLVYDDFTVFFRLFLLLFLVLVVALTVLGGIPDDEDSPDFYTLLLGSTLGMMLMASANHLLIIFLGIEMTSVPSYAMVGFMKGRRLSSEAALKYVVYGAGAAGVMLYGISLLAGLTGTAQLPALAEKIGDLFSGGNPMADPASRTVIFAVMLVLVGLAFKLSLVPFHFWCPDAFEGAPAEVAGFLSVASKGAAFALLVRFCLAISAPGTNLALAIGLGLGVIAAVTATFGNFAAYAQSNIKRLLAYSTIAHAGYMLMGVSAMLVLLSDTSSENALKHHAYAVDSLQGLLFYLVVYLFMNLGAFAVVALIRNQIYSEDINDYKGVGWQAPALGACMFVCLFSLIGLPPFGGFVAKFYIFASLIQAGAIHPVMWVILAIGGINTVFSLVYYIRILKVMYVDERPAGARRADVPVMPAGAYLALVTLPVIALGILANKLTFFASDVAGGLLSMLK